MQENGILPKEESFKPLSPAIMSSEGRNSATPNNYSMLKPLSQSKQTQVPANEILPIQITMYVKFRNRYGQQITAKKDIELSSDDFNTYRMPDMGVNTSNKFYDDKYDRNHTHTSYQPTRSVYVPIESYTMKIKPLEDYKSSIPKLSQNINIYTPIKPQPSTYQTKFHTHDNLFNRSSLYSSIQPTKQIQDSQLQTYQSPITNIPNFTMSSQTKIPEYPHSTYNYEGYAFNDRIKNQPNTEFGPTEGKYTERTYQNHAIQKVNQPQFGNFRTQPFDKKRSNEEDRPNYQLIKKTAATEMKPQVQRFDEQVHESTLSIEQPKSPSKSAFDHKKHIIKLQGKKKLSDILSKASERELPIEQPPIQQPAIQQPITKKTSGIKVWSSKSQLNIKRPIGPINRVQSSQDKSSTANKNPQIPIGNKKRSITQSVKSNRLKITPQPSVIIPATKLPSIIKINSRSSNFEQLNKQDQRPNQNLNIAAPVYQSALHNSLGNGHTQSIQLNKQRIPANVFSEMQGTKPQYNNQISSVIRESENKQGMSMPMDVRPSEKSQIQHMNSSPNIEWDNKLASIRQAVSIDDKAGPVQMREVLPHQQIEQSRVVENEESPVQLPLQPDNRIQIPRQSYTLPSKLTESVRLRSQSVRSPRKSIFDGKLRQSQKGNSSVSPRKKIFEQNNSLNQSVRSIRSYGFEFLEHCTDRPRGYRKQEPITMNVPIAVLNTWNKI